RHRPRPRDRGGRHRSRQGWRGSEDIERQDSAPGLPRRLSRRHAGAVAGWESHMSSDSPGILETIESVAGADGMFAGLDADARAAIEAEAQWTDLRSGDVLFREGDSGDALYVLISGRL